MLVFKRTFCNENYRSYLFWQVGVPTGTIFLFFLACTSCPIRGLQKHLRQTSINWRETRTRYVAERHGQIDRSGCRPCVLLTCCWGWSVPLLLLLLFRCWIRKLIRDILGDQRLVRSSRLWNIFSNILGRHLRLKGVWRRDRDEYLLTGHMSRQLCRLRDEVQHHIRHLTIHSRV